MEAIISLVVEAHAIHRLFIAHYFGENLKLQFLIKQVQSISGPCLDVLLCEKVKELPSFKFCLCLGDKNTKHLLDMLKLQRNWSTIDDYKFDEPHKTLYVVFMRDVSAYPEWPISSLLHYLTDTWIFILGLSLFFSHVIRYSPLLFTFEKFHVVGGLSNYRVINVSGLENIADLGLNRDIFQLVALLLPTISCLSEA